MEEKVIRDRKGKAKRAAAASVPLFPLSRSDQIEINCPLLFSLLANGNSGETQKGKERRLHDDALAN